MKLGEIRNEEDGANFSTHQFVVTNSEQWLKVKKSQFAVSNSEHILWLLLTLIHCSLLVTANITKPQLWVKSVYLGKYFRKLAIMWIFLFFFCLLISKILHFTPLFILICPTVFMGKAKGAHPSALEGT